MEREIYHLLIQSLSVHNSQGDHTNAETWEHNPSCSNKYRLNYFSHHCCLPRSTLTGSWSRSRNWVWNPALWCVGQDQTPTPEGKIWTQNTWGEIMLSKPSNSVQNACIPGAVPGKSLERSKGNKRILSIYIFISSGLLYIVFNIHFIYIVLLDTHNSNTSQSL